MAKFKFISVFLLSLSIFSIDGSILKANKIGRDDEHFIAAVYEHEPVKGAAVCYEKVCSRMEALTSVMENLAIYSEQTKDAKKLGADIIVFPEFGTTPWVPRNQVIPFSEPIPEPGLGPDWVPCDSEDSGFSITTQKELSCMAKDNEIYVVANMVDYKPCNECGEDFCLYNTNVMYDKRGRYVAKYHKYNLFNSEFPLFNIDREENNVYVDTEFGRLGLTICEDLLWQYPTVDLVASNNIDTMIFPTEWWDEYPHQLPHVAQASWAKALQINWVGSNFHNPSKANSGSGLFTTEGVIDYYHDVSLNSGGKLVTAELPVHPNKLKTQINWNNYYDLNEADYPVDGLKFVPLIYGDIFNMTEMDPSQNELKVCSNDENPLCCITKYEYSETETDGVFSLGVFKGIHTRDGSVRGSMGFGICTILKCNSRTSNMCDSYDYSFSGVSHTYFNKLELSGNFDKDTSVFPQSVFNELRLMPQLEKVLPDGRIILDLENGHENTPLISMSLFGRKFGDDGPPPEQWCPNGEFEPDSKRFNK